MHKHTQERRKTYINCILAQQNSYSEYSEVFKMVKVLKIKQAVYIKDYIVSRQLYLARKVFSHFLTSLVAIKSDQRP